MLLMLKGLKVSKRQGFDEIIGQELAKRVLIRAVREGNPTHAYLFLGLQGIGKTTTALEFAKALNCENPRDGNACGECAQCHIMEHGNSAEVRVWSPDGQNTKIDQMREMIDLAKFKPMRGKWKVNLIEQADTLNEESANCILKLLEEPPDYLINILIFRNAANILPTIRSRCQLVRFTQVNSAELVDRLLEDFDAGNEEARFLAAYSQGCPGRAIEMIGNDEFFRKRNAIIDIAADASEKKLWSALRLADILRSFEDKDEDGKKISSRDTLMETLDILLIWYRDLLAAKLQGENAAVVNVDKLEDITIQAAAYAHAGRLFNAVDAILYTKRGIQGNANTQMATEVLMMRLAAG